MPGRIFWALILTVALGMIAPASTGAADKPKEITNDLGMRFVLIPAGSFTMGSPDDEKNRRPNETDHRVTISKPYYLQNAEVTVAQWRGVMGCRMFGRRQGNFLLPVTKVSYFDVEDFIAALNASGKNKYRLPTESEWEYACRAGGQTPYWWGEKPLCEKAMFANNTDKQGRCADYYKSLGLASDSPAPIRSFKPNAWGLYDMAGNVWEWCQDWFGAYPPGKTTDPTGPSDGENRIRRGGSWYGGGGRLRSANRNFANPASRYATTGFRLVLEPAR